MKGKIGVIIIVVIIIVSGALSGYNIGRAIDRLFTPSDTVTQTYTEDDVYSVLDKIGLDTEYLSGYSTISEALIHSTEPIVVHDLGLTSEEMTALLNMYPQLLSSFFCKSLSFTTKSDDTADIEVLLDAGKLATVTNLPEATLSMMANTAVTINVSFTGVADDNSIIVVINEIKVGGMDISSYMSLVVGSNGSGRRENEWLNTEMPVNLGIFSELNSFRISNNMVYIDGTFSFNQVTGD
ncbi:MAG: hypothetical protein WCY62_03420 [Clostridia bacterium]|jgi:hypothetical protein